MAWLLLAVAGLAQAADDRASIAAAEPKPHWSGLPIWGVEAQARGYEIPLPFGVGATGFSARQPVDIHDLQLGRNGEQPASVSNFLQIDRVQTTQQNLSVKFDVLVLPFLSVYGIAGRTQGTTKGVIQVPATPAFGILEPRELQLDAAFDGPTLGAGLTMQGGKRISLRRDLMAIVVADWNRTRTDLTFENDALVADTKPEASVFSARLGLHGKVGDAMAGALWVGGMHQKIQQVVSGSVADTDLQFAVVQSPAKPWNTLLGGLLELDSGGSYVLVEGGFGARRSVLVSAVFRF